MKIAIVDDNEDDRKRLQEEITKFAITNQEKILKSQNFLVEKIL